MLFCDFLSFQAELSFEINAMMWHLGFHQCMTSYCI